MKARPAAVSAISLVFAMVCMGVQTRGQAANANGLIVGITGEWVLDPDAYVETGTQANPTSLKFLQSINVHPGTCAYGSGGYVAVQFGGKVSPFVCEHKTDDECKRKTAPKHDGWPSDKPVVCARHIVRPPDPSRWEAFTAAIIPLILPSPERFVAPVSRGLEAELSDAVVQLRGDSVDFASAFVDLDPGSYTVRLAPLDGSNSIPVSAAVNWNGSGSAPATAAELLPGLYRVVRLDPNGNPSGQDAWVLMCSPERFEKQSAEFSKAVEATKKWPTEVDARAPRAVLRAYLQALSQRP
jgi:hypothetical protein